MFSAYHVGLNVVTLSPNSEWRNIHNENIHLTDGLAAVDSAERGMNISKCLVSAL